jgi:hypothetical protein
MDAKEEWELRRENLLLKRALIEAQVQNQQAAHAEVTRQLAAMGDEYKAADE